MADQSASWADCNSLKSNIGNDARNDDALTDGWFSSTSVSVGGKVFLCFGRDRGAPEQSVSDHQKRAATAILSAFSQA